MVQASDPVFSDARLAPWYDVFEGARDDLDAYLDVVTELGARRVLDIGCGTGEFALRLTALGVEAIGLDPASASLDVARSKPGADRVRWIEGDVSVLPSVSVDLVTMMGNVAQVFVSDEDWADVLSAAAAALPAGGHLVFETRDPDRRAWEEWDPEASLQRAEDDNGEVVETWHEVVSVELPLVTFTGTFRFADGSTIISTSVLRFRTRDEVEHSLDEAGFSVVDVRDAPDRPGREFVFVACRR